MSLDQPVMLTFCNHHFHTECLRVRLAESNACPFRCERRPHVRLPLLTEEKYDEATGQMQPTLRDPQSVIRIEGVPLVFLRS